MKLAVYPFLLFAVMVNTSFSQSVIENVVPKQDFQQYGLALEAIFGIGIRLQAILNTTTDENFVVSPISATVLVGQLMLGAEGEFRDQLYDLLSLPRVTSHNNSASHYGKDKKNTTRSLPYAAFHLQLSSLVKTLQKRNKEELFTLNLNNALFYNENIELRSYFERCSANIYNTEITPLDFKRDTTDVINNWAAEHTNGLIKNVVTSPPKPSTSALFYNSIYFRAEWEQPFSYELNTRGKFFVNENKMVEVDYMTRLLERILYYETEQYQFIRLPYKNKELGLYIYLPKQDGGYKYDIKKFMVNLNPQEVLSTILNAQISNVVVRIPKLSLSNSLRILKPLQKYAEYKKVEGDSRKGNGSIRELLAKINDYKRFSPLVERDIFLTAAAKDANFKVSDIVQQTVFSVNEKGTEAASITSGLTDYILTKQVILNRPFSFFIRHEATLATLFWGTISDPTRN